MEAVIVAIIGLAGSGIGSVLGVIASAKLTSYRLEQLEKKVQAHNNLIERTYRLEERFNLVSHRIGDLEHALKNE